MNLELLSRSKKHTAMAGEPTKPLRDLPRLAKRGIDKSEPASEQEKRMNSRKLSRGKADDDANIV